MELGVLRDDMVEGLEHPSKGVLESEEVSVAMRTVPRHEFVPAEPELAYSDRAFDQHGTTVLAPNAVALLVEALAPRPGDSVLIVGSGVGYTAAVVAEIVGAETVSAIDLSRQLVLDARRNLARTGYEEVFVDRRDGAEGLPEYAPFDRILVEAAAVQPPRALLSQLSAGGRLVLPKGAHEQELVALKRDQADDRVTPTPRIVERLGEVRFRPLLVEGEQAGGIERNRTAREDRELSERAAERRRGWEQDWIDWERH